MDSVIVILQLLLLLAALPVGVMSWRTTRRDRSRHRGLAALAGSMATLAVVMCMLSVGLAEGSEEPVEPWLAFGTPVLTLLVTLLVLQRGLARPVRRR